MPSELNVPINHFLDWSRLQHDGFRWAPSTLLGGSLPSIDYYLPDVPFAEITEKGLMVTCPGVSLSCSDGLINKAFHFQDEWGSCYQVLCQEGANGELDTSQLTADPWQGSAVQSTRLAVIMPRKLTRTYEPYAVLVSVQDINEDVTQTRWLCNVAIVRIKLSEAEEVKLHIDSDRETEAIEQACQIADAIHHNHTTVEKGKESSLTSHPASLETKDATEQADVFESEYERLRQVDHSARIHLCSCKGQWVLRGRHTKSNQRWCIDW